MDYGFQSIHMKLAREKYISRFHGYSNTLREYNLTMEFLFSPLKKHAFRLEYAMIRAFEVKIKMRSFGITNTKKVCG